MRLQPGSDSSPTSGIFNTGADNASFSSLPVHANNRAVPYCMTFAELADAKQRPLLLASQTCASTRLALIVLRSRRVLQPLCAMMSQCGSALVLWPLGRIFRCGRLYGHFLRRGEPVAHRHWWRCRHWCRHAVAL